KAGRERGKRKREKGWPRKYIRLLTRATSTDALLRSASGSEVKGSAIRCGIGNYSPERGRALLTFITELSASLGKQCASFNPPSFSPSVSPSHNPVQRRSSFIECNTTTNLLLVSPLNGISVLSDGPRAELRPCTSLGRFLPLSIVATYSHSLSLGSLLIPDLCGIYRENGASRRFLSFSLVYAIAITMRSTK
ncbi:hypothetical protein ALC53_10545, partial [Atta colombica]